jgi:hypothetical protein
MVDVDTVWKHIDDLIKGASERSAYGEGFSSAAFVHDVKFKACHD